MTRRVVGILGGMGPEATILLQKKVLASVTGGDDADHLPLFVDMNPQVPSRIAHLIDGTGRNPGPTLAEMARRLEAAGATALAMPCNTAHHYAAFIRNAVSVPFLDMVGLTVAKVQAQMDRAARVGILASPALRTAGVLDAALERGRLVPRWPEQPERLLEAIRTIKADGPNPTARRILSDAAEEMLDRGATQLIVACTEFSLIADTLPCGVQTMDTIDVLTGAIHDHILMK